MAGEQRQFVNFLFYKIDSQWWFLPDEERRRGKEQFREVVESYSSQVLVVSYTTLGIRADADMMLWRISEDLDLFSKMSAQLFGTGLGKYLRTSYSYLSMTKTSVYVSEHQHSSGYAPPPRHRGPARSHRAGRILPSKGAHPR